MFKYEPSSAHFFFFVRLQYLPSTAAPAFPFPSLCVRTILEAPLQRALREGP